MNNETGNVVKKEANLPTASLFENDASQGLENMDQQDLALPFLRILGQLSPQVNKRDSKYVEGAEPGMIYNTVTHEVYDGTKGINVVPCYYKREYIEWQDRGEGSGAPVAIHDKSSGIINETTRDSINKDRLKNGNYLENTASYFVIVSKDNGAETALITMKSTQLKVSKNWNSIISGIKLQGKNGMFTPPMCSHLYNLKTVPQSNDKGSWFGWSVSKIGPIQDKALYEQAKSFADSIKKGAIQTKHGKEEITEDKVPY